jgi:hypothetical protein
MHYNSQFRFVSFQSLKKEEEITHKNVLAYTPFFLTDKINDTHGDKEHVLLRNEYNSGTEIFQFLSYVESFPTQNRHKMK